MSRVGKQPVALPDKVQVKLEGNKVTVEGPLGRLERSLSEGITCQNDAANRRLVLSRASDTKQQRMLHGLDQNPSGVGVAEKLGQTALLRLA